MAATVEVVLGFEGDRDLLDMRGAVSCSVSYSFIGIAPEDRLAAEATLVPNVRR
jgi:hypothetical protein